MDDVNIQPDINNELKHQTSNQLIFEVFLARNATGDPSMRCFLHITESISRVCMYYCTLVKPLEFVWVCNKSASYARNMN